MRDYRLYLSDIFAAMVAIQEFIEALDTDRFMEASRRPEISMSLVLKLI